MAHSFHRGARNESQKRVNSLRCLDRKDRARGATFCGVSRKGMERDGNLHRRCFAQRHPHRPAQFDSLEGTWLAFRTIATFVRQGGRGDRRSCTCRNAEAWRHTARRVKGAIEEQPKSAKCLECIVERRTAGLCAVCSRG